MVEKTRLGKVRYSYRMGDAATGVDLTQVAARAYGQDLIDEANHGASGCGITVSYTTIGGRPVPVSPPTPERATEIGLELLSLADDEDTSVADRSRSTAAGEPPRVG